MSSGSGFAILNSSPEVQVLAIALVFLGGGAGSVLRYLVGLGLARWLGTGFPWGTLAVNCAGCFAIGLLARLLPLPDAGGAQARLALMTGLLGGFTTYSAFALDSAGLWREGEALTAILYVGGTLAAALGGVAAGLALGGWLQPR